MDLVELLYEKLSNLQVTTETETRKLRVYWDMKCLKPGDHWESAFLAAISSSKVVVSVLSSGTFSKEGHPHNVGQLECGSKCDNVLLEIEVAMYLQAQKKTTVFPLLVGPVVHAPIGGGVAELYDDFFSAKSVPAELPSIRVECIDKKLHELLGPQAPDSHPVDVLFKNVLALQGHKLKGLRREVALVLLALFACPEGVSADCFADLAWQQSTGCRGCCRRYRTGEVTQRPNLGLRD